MDADYAKNYWRTVFVNQSEGTFDATAFDKWFPSFGTSDFGDHIHRAFLQMLAACAQGRFGAPPESG